MTKEQILKFARQAGLQTSQQSAFEFAALVASAEREACAKLAQETVCDTHIPTGIKIYGTQVAKAIRARNL